MYHLLGPCCKCIALAKIVYFINDTVCTYFSVHQYKSEKSVQLHESCELIYKCGHDYRCLYSTVFRALSYELKDPSNWYLNSCYEFTFRSIILIMHF